MAILLCRRICTATRGWTSRVASSDPHVLRAPCTVILETPALVMPGSKLRLKLPGSVSVPGLAVHTRPVSIQALPAWSRSAFCCCLRSLSAVMHSRAGEWRLRGVGLGLAAENLTPYTLDLLADGGAH